MPGGQRRHCGDGALEGPSCREAVPLAGAWRPVFGYLQYLASGRLSCVSTRAVLVSSSPARLAELMRRHLAPEVQTGLLSARQYELIVSRRRRWRQTFRRLEVDGVEETRLWRRLVAAATELAFKQQQALNDGDERLAQ